MSSLLNYPRRSRQFHHGQALVEYAILLILLVTLFVGGTELGITALASNKNTEAAKTGISEYAVVNQLRLNAVTSAKQYQLNLASYNCKEFTASGLSVTCAETTPTDFIDTLDSIDNTSTSSRIDDLMLEFDSLVSEAEDIESTYDAANAESSIDTDFGYSQTPSSIVNSYATLDIAIPVSSDDLKTLQELENALIGASIPTLNTFDNGTEEDTLTTPERWKLIHREGRLKYKALMLIHYVKLSLLPLQTEVSLSNAKVSTYDNTSASPLASASCNEDGTYDDGFPIDAGYRRFAIVKYKDDSGEEQTYQTGEMVYLFNPLPIDVSSCSGTDSDRDNKSRLRILIDGYTPTAAKLAESGKTFEELFVPGLPKLNQAMYSNYDNVCVDGSNQYVSCSSSNVAQRYLKPPGKICFNNVETPGVDSCIGNANNALTTGFYFFANASDSPLHSFEYTQNDDDVDGDGNSDFRPAIQVECKTTPDKNLETVYDSDCDGTQSKVRIHTRYRRVFEGFLTFGLMTLTNTNLLPYFYNPNQVGVAEHVVIGSHGSEVGPLGRGGAPTIKHFMDFRGCYEVDVETNQISACN